MITMTSTNRIAADLFAECGEDYVGLWQICRSLPQTEEPMQDTVADVVAIVRQLLSMPGVRLGQCDGSAFVPWVDDTFEVLARLERQLHSLGRHPDVGQIAWLTRD